MHDTAAATGRAFLELYAPKKGGRIAEIGSYDVNGTLRSAAPNCDEYVGIDLGAGPGVDVVAEAGQPLPLPDATFDCVLASSAFEHDPKFWFTFTGMCRICKPGGYVYISAPTNGAVHRYPYDCWRFYPDAGIALQKISVESDYPTTLIESFMTDRMAEAWNDFVGVFQRGTDISPVASRIHHAIGSHNIYDISSPELQRSEWLPYDYRQTLHLQDEINKIRHENSLLKLELDAIRAGMHENAS
jgi:SAM-dependent methyltransferase